MFKTLLLLIVLFMAGQTHVFGAGKENNAKKAPLHIVADSTKINVRHFDNNALKKYQADPDFNYVEHPTGLTWWDRFWIWVWDMWSRFWLWVEHILQRLFGSVSAGKNAASVFKYVILALAAALIIYIIFRLIGIDLLKLFRKKQDEELIPYNEYIENIHEINFDDAIENALQVKDYRLAVRLLYLRSLKQLSDKNIINWKIDKTNQTYLNEITDSDQRRLFAVVTRQFEYVWYGDFPVDGESFQNIRNIFQDFKQQLA